MLFITNPTPETLSIIIAGFTWVEMLIITLSYFIAFKIKKTFGIGAIFIYFLVSTLVYFLLFTRLVYCFLEFNVFFLDCAAFFILIGSIRFITGLILLVSIWKQNDK